MADNKGKPAPAAAKPSGAKKKSKSPKPFKAGRSCPKCGPGVHLAAHQNRLSCGRCGYTEYTSPRS